MSLRDAFLYQLLRSLLFRLLSTLLALFIAPTFAFAICDGYRLTTSIEPEFSDTEKNMICGFEQAQGTAHKAWVNIPKSQALQAARAALQTRGHLDPKFNDQGDVIEINPGEVTRVSSVRAEGAPEAFSPDRRRNIDGEPLTPEILNDLETWTIAEIQNLGFPCPVISSRGEPGTGEVLLQVAPGERRSFGPVFTQGADEALVRNLSRFYTFAPDEPYGRVQLEATRRRLVVNGIVENTNFVPVCSEATTDASSGVIQMVVPGSARQLISGLSANTEEYFRANLTARFNRLDKNASSAQIDAAASFRVQQVAARGEWRPWRAPSMSRVEPLLMFRRQDEAPFTASTQLFQLSLAQTYDFRQGYEIQWRAGPGLSVYNTTAGPGPETAQTFSLWADLWIRDFEFFLYGPEPRQGFQLGSRLSLTDRSILSSFSMVYLELSGTQLWNIGRYDPPRYVLAVRGVAASTMIDDESGGMNALPPQLRHYIGGFNDVRGFDRLSIPGNGLGGLSRAALSVELRPDLFATAWKPFVFVDAGAVGQSSLGLDDPIFWSPGIGVKYHSPIGPLRGSIANGQILGDAPGAGPGSRWQIFLSWGELF